ncbi:hypothetical protein GBA52_022859, partial [Prunus armeniaca]
MANSNHRNSTAISIEDRNVEGESGNEGGAAKKGRSKWLTTELAILFPPKWETVFAVSCALAVFLDPVYPYIPVMKEGDDMCYYWDESLMWEFFVLRSALDLFYAMDIVIFWRQRNGNNAKAFRASSEKRETTVKGTILKLLPFLRNGNNGKASSEKRETTVKGTILKLLPFLRNGNNGKASSEKRETVKGTILKLLPFLTRAYVALPFPQ